MAKPAIQGFRKETALVVAGWLAFVIGNSMHVLWLAIILKAIARVLP